MPALAPASIDMLQIVIRPSIESSRIDRTAILDDVPDPAAGADLADDRQNDVLGGCAVSECAVDGDRHRFWFAGGKGLGCEHMLDLACANTKGQRSKCAMRGGVTVAADDRHARQSDALFGADDMDDSLTRHHPSGRA